MERLEELQKGVRKLRTDANGDIMPFRANGTLYVPLAPGSGIPLGIWKEYEKMRMVVSFGRNFEQIVDSLNEIEQMLGSDMPLAQIRVKCILSINSIKRGVLELSSERQTVGAYMASLFIRADGQSFSEWSIEQADKAISDWIKEGITSDELFFFAVSRTVGLKAFYRKISSQLIDKAPNP
jgi:hypothetical protein